MRIIGLDLGTKTLGVAISDQTETIASGVTTIRFSENDFESCLKELEKIIALYEVKLIVIGLPKNMNNSYGEATLRTKEFSRKLENKFNIEVVMQDERLSSVAANNVLLLADLSRRKRKSKVDTVAATIILQSYLDIRKGQKHG